MQISNCATGLTGVAVQTMSHTARAGGADRQHRCCQRWWHFRAIKHKCAPASSAKNYPNRAQTSCRTRTGHTSHLRSASKKTGVAARVALKRRVFCYHSRSTCPRRSCFGRGIAGWRPLTRCGASATLLLWLLFCVREKLPKQNQGRRANEFYGVKTI